MRAVAEHSERVRPAGGNPNLLAGFYDARFSQSLANPERALDNVKAFLLAEVAVERATVATGPDEYLRAQEVLTRLQHFTAQVERRTVEHVPGMNAPLFYGRSSTPLAPRRQARFFLGRHERVRFVELRLRFDADLLEDWHELLAKAASGVHRRAPSTSPCSTPPAPSAQASLKRRVA
jgi:hypothetical protein